VAKLRIAHIASVGIGAGLVAAAVHGEWPMVFFCMLGLILLTLIERL
jgi:hypothetical protein